MKDQTQNVNMISLGCAKNLVDSEILLGGLKKSQVNIVEDVNSADTIVINTCGFLDIAREESVDTILQAAELKETGNLSQLVVMGCLSERYPAELKKDIPEVDRFFGTNDHHQIVSFLTGKDFAKDDPLFKRSLLTPNHYAYLKIAEGCDNACSFCSIPIMRGKQISRSVEAIKSEAERLVKNGTKELLIIAQDTTSYGWDLEPKQSLDDVIRELDKIGDPLKWIRLHYAHPSHLSQEIIDAMAESDKVCRYLDIPVQHISNHILQSMQRGLGEKGIRNRLDRLKQAIPGMRIRTTIIVGYPGETENDFLQLCNFIRETQFDRLGIFTYSEEDDTLAANLEDDVPRAVKDERKMILQEIQMEINLNKNTAIIGKTIDVLIDETKEDFAIGRTEFDSPEVDNRVIVYGDVGVGDFLQVRISDANEFELMGKVFDS